jgi:hypothetical protein
MAAYLQMGNDSNNLIIGPTGIDGFDGIILSPVNESASDLSASIPKFREKGSFDIVFDPQLYCPQSERGQLPSHPYFPKDLDTADPASEAWWKNIIKHLVDEADQLGVDAICSPAILPRKSSSDYFTRVAEIHSLLAGALQGSSIRPVMTVCVRLQELEKPEDALRIASIVTTRGPQAIYLVVESEVEPRREIPDPNLLSLMVLVSTLEKSGCRVLVSHCSSDMVLMKAAGATHCASGKFFNLRRFTRGRFDEKEDDGGKMIAYWFEHNLMAFLRRADVARFLKAWPTGFIGGGDSDNLFSNQILDQFAADPTKPWVALGWRQYLAWFLATEHKLSTGGAFQAVSGWLKESEGRWNQIEDKEILLDEPRNNGSWLRPWRQILSDFHNLDN